MFPEDKSVNVWEKYSQMYKISIYYPIYLDKYTNWKQATTLIPQKLDSKRFNTFKGLNLNIYKDLMNAL